MCRTPPTRRLGRSSVPCYSIHQRHRFFFRHHFCPLLRHPEKRINEAVLQASYPRAWREEPSHRQIDDAALSTGRSDVESMSLKLLQHHSGSSTSVGTTASSFASSRRSRPAMATLLLQDISGSSSMVAALFLPSQCELSRRCRSAASRTAREGSSVSVLNRSSASAASVGAAFVTNCSSVSAASAPGQNSASAICTGAADVTRRSSSDPTYHIRARSSSSFAPCLTVELPRVVVGAPSPDPRSLASP